jgi:hypothetical protein
VEEGLGGDCCTTDSPQGRVLLSPPFAKNYGVMVRLSEGAAYEHSRCRLELQLFHQLGLPYQDRDTHIRTKSPAPHFGFPFRRIGPWNYGVRTRSVVLMPNAADVHSPNQIQRQCSFRSHAGPRSDPKPVGTIGPPQTPRVFPIHWPSPKN